jgi:hypothetical protein
VLALVLSVRNPTEIQYHPASIPTHLRQLATLHNKSFSLSALHTISKSDLNLWDRRGRGRIVVGFTTTYAISAYHRLCCEFESRPGRARCTALYDKVCQ